MSDTDKTEHDKAVEAWGEPLALQLKSNSLAYISADQLTVGLELMRTAPAAQPAKLAGLVERSVAWCELDPGDQAGMERKGLEADEIVNDLAKLKLTPPPSAVQVPDFVKDWVLEVVLCKTCPEPRRKVAEWITSIEPTYTPDEQAKLAVEPKPLDEGRIKETVEKARAVQPSDECVARTKGESARARMEREGYRVCLTRAEGKIDRLLSEPAKKPAQEAERPDDAPLERVLVSWANPDVLRKAVQELSRSELARRATGGGK